MSMTPGLGNWGLPVASASCRLKQKCRHAFRLSLQGPPRFFRAPCFLPALTSGVLQLRGTEDEALRQTTARGGRALALGLEGGGGPLRGPRMLLESSPAATLQVSNEVIRRSKLPAHCCFPCWRFHSLRPSSPLLRRQNSAQDSEGLAMPRRSRMKPQWVLHEQVPALSCVARPCMVLHGHWK